MHIWMYVKTQSALNSLNMIFCAGSLSGIYVLTGGNYSNFFKHYFIIVDFLVQGQGG